MCVFSVFHLGLEEGRCDGDDGGGIKSKASSLTISLFKDLFYG